MKIPDLIRVSKASLLSKRFGVTEEELYAKFHGAELNEALALLPTPEEKEFMEIFQSTIPQLARLQRKMSVCIDAEVIELTEDLVVYEYSGKKYRIESPKNAFKICNALERGTLDGVAEMVSQKCISINDELLTDIRNNTSLAVDELQLLIRIASKFFFQIFLA